MLGPHACFRGIPTLWRSFSDETLIRGPRGSTHVAFSVRGLNNALSWWIRFVYVISKWKPKDRPKVPPVYPRLIRGGSLLLHVQHTSISVIACNVDSHTRELGLTSRSIHHPCACMLGPHACSRGIPALGRSFSDETLIRGPRGSTHVAFSLRGLNNTLSWWFRFVEVISTWKTKDRPKVPLVYPRLIRGGSLLLHVQ